MNFTLEQLKVGNRDAWYQAYELFFKIVQGVLNLNFPLVSKEDIEDVAIDSIIKLIEEYLEKAQSVDDLKRLLATTAKHKYLDLLKKQNSLKRGGGKLLSLSDLNEVENVKCDASTPDSEIDQIERVTIIQDALRNIPPRYRDIVTDHFFLNLPHKEIAEKRNLEIGSIGVYINRGLKALEPFLKKSNLL